MSITRTEGQWLVQTRPQYTFSEIEDVICAAFCSKDDQHRVCFGGSKQLSNANFPENFMQEMLSGSLFQSNTTENMYAVELVQTSTSL